jgi:uncharacterized protein (DUF1697 family)
MKMSDVCEWFKELGFDNIHSVLATGNIIFTTDKIKNTWDKIVGERLSEYYSFPIDVFIKNAQEVRNILKNNPFEMEQKQYIQTFVCHNGFEMILLEEWNRILPIENEKVAINNHLFYWQVEKSMVTKSHFFRILSRKTLKHSFTLRTIGSMGKISDRMALLGD